MPRPKNYPKTFHDRRIHIERDRQGPYYSNITNETRLVKFHGHCQQKALISTSAMKRVFILPVNYTVEEIILAVAAWLVPSGMRPSMYDISMKIGEMFCSRPCALRRIQPSSPPRTSCRHHIKDGTGRIGASCRSALGRAD